jgi:site-specific recombinase XerD
MARVGRNREKNKRLPKGWAYGPARKDGTRTLYFKPTNAEDRAIVKSLTGGPLVLRLGNTMDEASKVYAEQIIAARERDRAVDPTTVAELCRRARLEFLPTIENEKTREERERHIAELDRLFGRKRFARNVYEASRDTAGTYMRAMDVQRHVFEFRGKKGAVSVNRRVRTWELVFQWGRAPWGLTEYNPCEGIQPNPERPRDVLPDDRDVWKLYRRLDPPARFMVAAIRFYGRRKVELLGLQVQSAQDDGLHFRRAKDAGSRELILIWDDRLRRMWARLMRWRDEVQRGGKIASMAAILNRKGKPYTETGFNSARKRAMKRAKIPGRFTFHDLRAARASTLSPEKAVEVLAHDDPRTTARVYRRGPRVISLNSDKLPRISEKK